MGLSMGKPTGRHPFPITYSQKPKRGPSFRNFFFALRFVFDRLSKSQKWSIMTKCSSRLGQGPTSPQHSPVTHSESLWSDQFYLEFLKLLRPTVVLQPLSQKTLV